MKIIGWRSPRTLPLPPQTLYLFIRQDETEQGDRVECFSGVMAVTIAASGVPGTGMRKLIGTESTSRSRRANAMLTRSSMDSPMPRMPPLQADRPIERSLDEQFDPLFIGVSRADPREIFSGGLDVVMVPVQSGVLEVAELIAAQRAERGAG